MDTADYVLFARGIGKIQDLLSQAGVASDVATMQADVLQALQAGALVAATHAFQRFKPCKRDEWTITRREWEMRMRSSRATRQWIDGQTIEWLFLSVSALDAYVASKVPSRPGHAEKHGALKVALETEQVAFFDAVRWVGTSGQDVEEVSPAMLAQIEATGATALIPMLAAGSLEALGWTDGQWEPIPPSCFHGAHIADDAGSADGTLLSERMVQRREPDGQVYSALETQMTLQGKDAARWLRVVLLRTELEGLVSLSGRGSREGQVDQAKRKRRPRRPTPPQAAVLAWANEWTGTPIGEMSEQWVADETSDWAARPENKEKHKLGRNPSVAQDSVKALRDKGFLP